MKAIRAPEFWCLYVSNNMGWKTIIIGSECKISLSMNRIKVIIDEDFNYIPISDVDTVIFSHDGCVITIPLIAKLLENNVNIVVCDSKNDPIGVFNAFNSHSLAFKQVAKQIEWRVTRKKKLWKKIVTDKIQSEIDTVIYLGLNRETVTKLKEFKNSIYNDDLTNREAVAARVYFSELFGSNFSRDDENDLRNYSLNYGYKILASYISKCLVSRGLITQLGIHHIGESNPFNLTYDFIEPLRAIVDIWTYRYIKDEFRNAQKRELIEILEWKVKVAGKWFRLSDAIEDVMDSYIAFLNEEREDILRVSLVDGIKGAD